MGDPSSLPAQRYLLLVSQLVEERGGADKHGVKAEVGRELGIRGPHVTMLLAGTKEPGLTIIERAKERLKLRAEFFTRADLDAPNYRDFVGRVESHVELDPVVIWPAWERLEEEGIIDEYRARGLSEQEVQHVRRTPWRGQPTERDFVRELDSKLAGPRPPGREPEPARAARTKKS